MEDLNTPPSPSNSDRDTIRQRNSRSSLSVSEPTLRFPRPQGDRRLANWVSTSQPDIMHTSDVQEENSLLSDSTYEVIHNTDTESQDGFAPESVYSSDYPRSEDVSSLTGTEHTQEHGDDAVEEEEDEEDGSETGAHSEHGDDEDEDLHHDDDDDGDDDGDDDDDDDNDTGYVESSQMNFASEDAASFEKVDAFPSAPETVETPSHSGILERSVRDSIQYAEESLRAPSANTSGAEDKNISIAQMLTNRWNNLPGGSKNVILALTGVFLFATVVSVMTKLGGPSQPPRIITPISQPPTTVYVSIKNPTTSTVIINHTSTKTIRVSATSAAPAASKPSPPHNTPLLGGYQAESRAICSAEVQGRREILVKIPEGTKLSWLAKDAISIDVFRGENLIKAKFSSVDEGILVEIPKKEAHGILNVTVTTTRRPKVNETFAVDLGTSVLDQALDFGRLMFQDVTSKFQVDTFKASFSEAMELAEKQAEKHLAKPRWLLRFQEQVKQRTKEMKEDMETTKLNGQISANLVWLKMQGKRDQYEVYLKKARAFMMQRQASLLQSEDSGNKKSGFSLWAQQ